MIRLEHVSKTYERSDGERITALSDISCDITAGEFVALRGASGSGKSSLLNIIGCLDRPTSGRYLMNGRSLEGLSDARMSDLRGQRIGFVFQAFHLLARMTAAENVELPLLYAKGRADRAKALALLARVGLAERADHYGVELSGGEQQRVALARALINDPPLILADEPTGNLDSRAAAEVMSLLSSLNRDGHTIVLVTHDDAVASYATRELRIRDGCIVDSEANTGSQRC